MLDAEQHADEAAQGGFMAHQENRFPSTEVAGQMPQESGGVAVGSQRVGDPQVLEAAGCLGDKAGGVVGAAVGTRENPIEMRVELAQPFGRLLHFLHAFFGQRAFAVRPFPILPVSGQTVAQKVKVHRVISEGSPCGLCGLSSRGADLVAASSSSTARWQSASCARNLRRPAASLRTYEPSSRS